MPKNSGDVFGAGVRILLVGPNEPLQITGSGGHVACLRFVDGMGNTLIPEYDPQMLLLPEGSIAGAKYTVVSDADLAVLQGTITELSGQITTLAARVTALEARFTPTALKAADYTAVAWEHVLVDMAAAAGNVTITMPTSPAPAVGDRVKVSDVAAGGGVGVGFTLRVATTFAPTSTTHYAASPYAVADIGSGGSVVGANAELVYVGTGWYVVAEGCQPVQLA
jgi:hypothetical protein